MAQEDIDLYEGKQIDVSWDGRLCIHIGECGRAKGDLFVSGREPWCEPDVAILDEVIEIVERCPTGSLTYRRKDGGQAEQSDKENTVMVSYNGPLLIRGDLVIEGAAGDMPGIRSRAALCRCGQSKKKPFCDNSHEAVGFQDYGPVGEKGKGLDSMGGKLKVTLAKDGPLLFSGNFAIFSNSGRKAWQGKSAALCRCGHSKNKPFCDGMHKERGFVSD